MARVTKTGNYAPINRGNLSPSGGYDLITFGENWEPILNCFQNKTELQKCLIWLKNSDYNGTTIFCDTQGVVAFVSANWWEPLKRFAPGGITCRPGMKINRYDRTEYTRTDKDGNEFAQNGLVIMINNRPVHE